MQIEEVAIVSGGMGVVEKGLIAGWHAKDLTQDLSGLAGREGKRDSDIEARSLSKIDYDSRWSTPELFSEKSFSLLLIAL